MLGDTSTWMLKVSVMISRIGMERGRVTREGTSEVPSEGEGTER